MVVPVGFEVDIEVTHVFECQPQMNNTEHTRSLQAVWEGGRIQPTGSWMGRGSVAWVRSERGGGARQGGGLTGDCPSPSQQISLDRR
ncbi:hypothetical protein J6590_072214 [Homalodisca vitripennis]|nr:hypothetical protein J6590_072214 [Homalodisca vitripennis]